MSDYGHEGQWDRRFLWLWGLSAVVLGVLFFRLSFREWSFAAGIGFGVPEAIGVFRRGDRFPPLTFAIRRYVPRWAAFPAINGFLGGAAAYWLSQPHPIRYLVLFGLQGWLLNHFDVTYDGR